MKIGILTSNKSDKAELIIELIKEKKIDFELSILIASKAGSETL